MYLNSLCLSEMTGDPSLTFRFLDLGSTFTTLFSVITMLYIFKPIQMQVSVTFLQCTLFLPRTD
jgi:hypothetical protein